MKKIICFLALCSSLVSNAQDPDYPVSPAMPGNLVAAEYWIDTDPGIGAATSISVSPSVNMVNVIASLNTTGLSNGVHRFALRTRNGDGKWSLTSITEFLVDADPGYPAAPAAATNLVSAEYWIDADPGMGNANPIAVSPAVNINNLVTALNTTGLSNGIHYFALRSRNENGIWSLTTITSFLVDNNPLYPSSPLAPGNIIAAEYFIDSDPGMGNGIPIALSPAVDINNIAVPINTTGLSFGAHNLFIRSKNVEGAWSLSNIHNFIVNNDFSYPPAPAAPGNIIYAEYFFDTDPGFGNGTSISISPGVDLSNITFSANTASLSNGAHILFIRSLDDWSITNFVSFNVGTILPLNFISFTAVASNNNALLNWQTDNEVNTSHFEIEFSKDGVSFTKIAEQQSMNQPGNHLYSYLHLVPGEGIIYYRLRQVDLDGNYKYSKTVALKMDPNKKTELMVYPNPARNQLNLGNIQVSAIKSIQIVALDGRVVMQPVADVSMQFNIGQLSSGTYYIRVLKTDGKIVSIPFVKE